MSIFNRATDRQVNLGITLLRIVVGAIFVAHGAQKVFVFGFDGVAGAFAGMGIPLAGFFGPFVALVELFGGLALIAGLLTRLASVGLASTMIVAILTVHIGAGFFAPNGVEFPLSLLAGTTLLAMTGAGAWSIDAIIGGNRTPKSETVLANRELKRAA